MDKKIKNNIIEQINNELICTMDNLVREEKGLANYFSYQGSYDLAEKLYLDILILEKDLCQIRGGIFDRDIFEMDLGEMSKFYKERHNNIDIKTLNYQERKNQLLVKASEIDWLYNGQWIDFVSNLWELREKYENLAAITLASKNYMRLIRIYDRIIGLNSDLISYIDDSKDKISLSENYRDLAAIYRFFENTKEEEKYLILAMEISKNIEDEDLEISIKVNLSKSYYGWIEFLKENSRYKEAANCAKEAIKILKKCQKEYNSYHIDSGLIDLYNILTEVYYNDKDYKQALKYSILALSKSKAYNKGLETKNSKRKLDRALLNRVKIEEVI